jgi:cellulose synthase/poly-beta-1,6-N-acetylglucosamine synthase-like glycosyltransferase
MPVGDLILVTLAALAVLPVAWLALETFFALLPYPKTPTREMDPRAACAILIPAHNEEAGIAATLAHLKPELQEGDRIIVIADNCSDLTAEVGRAHNVEAIERFDPDRRGKGFALDFGLNHLASKPPEVVVLIDADTRVAPSSLDALVRAAGSLQSPVQGVFTDSPRARGPREQWSAFALTFKNLIRPLGLYRMGMPCLLTGSGMAFPWTLIQKSKLGTSNIVEDMQLGIDLALAGHAPRFCPQARFESDDAPSQTATTKRRTRWEHGHVRTLLTQAPRLFLAGLFQLRPRLIALAIELAIPPLSLLMVAQILLLTVCAIWWLTGGSVIPAAILSVGGIVAATTVLLAWWKFGRRLISPKILFLLPVYVLWKIPIYLKLILAPERRWVRTERKPTA